jgi:hypothetical protein
VSIIQPFLRSFAPWRRIGAIVLLGMMLVAMTTVSFYLISLEADSFNTFVVGV